MAMTSTFDEKSIAALHPRARLRLEHAGQWIVWRPGHDEIVAHGQDWETVRARAIAAGVEQPAAEWVSPSLAKTAGSGV